MYRFCAIPSVLVIGGLTPLSLRKEKEGMTGREGVKRERGERRGGKMVPPPVLCKSRPANDILVSKRTIIRPLSLHRNKNIVLPKIQKSGNLW